MRPDVGWGGLGSSGAGSYLRAHEWTIDHPCVVEYGGIDLPVGGDVRCAHEERMLVWFCVNRTEIDQVRDDAFELIEVVRPVIDELRDAEFRADRRFPVPLWAESDVFLKKPGSGEKANVFEEHPGLFLILTFNARDDEDVLGQEHDCQFFERDDRAGNFGGGAAKVGAVESDPVDDDISRIEADSLGKTS